MTNCTTNRKTIWLLFALLSLQIFAFVGQNTQATSSLPFQPTTELVKDSKGLLLVDVFQGLKIIGQEGNSSLVSKCSCYSLQQKIQYSRVQTVHLKQIKQKKLQFDTPDFFFPLKIPADDSVSPLFFS